MQVHGVTPILNVSSVEASIEWFAHLGWTCGFAHNADGFLEPGLTRNASGPATFASVQFGKGQVFLCQDGQGLRGGKPARFDGDDDTGATWMSIWLGSPAEVDEAHQLALRHGMTVIWPPTDEPWGVRECRLMHPDGHVFRFSGSVRQDEPREPAPST